MIKAPEQLARRTIEEKLAASGWSVQDSKGFNPSVGRGIARCEVPLKSERCDYLLMVDRTALGMVEAKKEGTTLSTVADQSGYRLWARNGMSSRQYL
jgi:type I restriction enzyme R subunit